MKGALLGGCGGDPRETIGTLFIPTASVLIKKNASHTLTHNHSQEGQRRRRGGMSVKTAEGKGRAGQLGHVRGRGGLLNDIEEMKYKYYSRPLRSIL